MIYINKFCSLSALGCTEEEILNNLHSHNLNTLNQRDDLLLNHESSYFGEIKANLPDISKFKRHNTKNNQYLALCLEQLKTELDEFIKKYGKARIGVVIGTSTSGLEETEKELKSFIKTGIKNADFYFNMQEFGDPAIFIADYLDLEGPCYTISTACSSSARVFISAKHMLEANLVDMVIVGGADSLCSIPINGFKAMEVLSNKPCTPFCENRSGINIGEAAGLMLLSKEKSNLALLGVGESSDAHHISAPDPTGDGAFAAMQMALKDAKLESDEIGYINLHGTGTKLNDDMESKAVYKLFQNKVPVSSTKYLTGHCLGAAGILEACLLAYILKHNLNLPLQDTTRDKLDPNLAPCNFVQNEQKAVFKNFMSNSFAFGGNNASIIIGALDD